MGVGNVTRMVIGAAIAALAFAGAASAQGGGGGRLMQMDTNHDGSITRAEAEASRAAMFQRLDADHDGFVTQAERDAARQARGQNSDRPAPPRGQMMNADTNNDGRISRQEFMAQPYRIFDVMDADHNGTITAAEIEAGRAARGGG